MSEPRLRAFLVLGVLAALLGLPSRARGQNVLSNPGFDRDLSSWSASGGVSTSWSPLDAQGSPFSGSARVTGGSVAGGLSQCVAVRPNDFCIVSGKIRVPSGQSAAGIARYLLLFYTDAGCASYASGNDLQTPIVYTLDSWERVVRSRPAPADARSARFTTWLARDPGSSGSFEAFFDDASLLLGLPGETGAVLTLPAAASIHGARGAFWQTDLWAMNRSFTTPLTVTATYRCFAGQACGVGSRAFSLAPRGSLLLVDIVGAFLGAPETAGAIELGYDPALGGLSAMARVYTPAPPAPSGGVSIPGLATTQVRSKSLFLGLASNGGSLSGGFRTNAGAYNPTGDTVFVTLTLYAADGMRLGAPVTRTWAPREAYQLSDVFAAAGAGGTVTTNAYLVAAASVPVFFYVTVIDNSSGDPLFVPPSEDE